MISSNKGVGNNEIHSYSLYIILFNYNIRITGYEDLKMERISGQPLSVREQQDVMLEMMRELHSFFARNEIRYIMIYGTLLGAVRHKGFIPWDNDMDIGVPRPDYERLLNMLNNGTVINPHFYHLHYTVDDAYHYLIIRICDDRTTVDPPYVRDKIKKMGVWVDIFPVDGVPGKSPVDLFNRFRLYLNKMIQPYDIWTLRNRRDAWGRFSNFVCFIFPRTKRRNYLIDKLSSRIPFSEAKNVAVVIERNKHFICYKKEDFDNPLIMSFENTEFFGPHNYDSALRQVFGDYMQMPPVEKRKPHNTNCRWA